MDFTVAGTRHMSGARRALLGGAAALAVIGIAVVVTLVGNTQESSSPHMIAATQPSRRGPAPTTPLPVHRLTAVTTTTTVPATTTYPMTTTRGTQQVVTGLTSPPP